MLELHRSEVLLLLREGQATRHSDAPFCEQQLPHDISPEHHEWFVRSQDHPLELLQHNATLTWRFAGHLDLTCFERAVRELVCRHTILASTLKRDAEAIRFVARAAPKIVIRTWVARNASEKEALEKLQELTWSPFNLSVEGPIRVGTVEIGDADYVISFTVHHSFVDLYSMRIISHELAVLYNAHCQGVAAPLDAPLLQFFDCLVSLEKWRSHPRALNYLSYWESYLDGASAIEYSRTHKVSNISVELPADFMDAMRVVCTTSKVGPHVFWDAVHHVALWQLLGKTDLTTLFVDVGRRQKELVRLVGPFANLVPQRTQLQGRTSFRSFLQMMACDRRTSLTHSAAPYHFIAEKCASEYTSSFGVLNFLPADFFPLQSFGPCPGTAPPPGTFFDTPWFPFPYIIVVDGSSALSRVTCYGVLSAPFTPSDLLKALVAIARAVALMPDNPLSSIDCQKHVGNPGIRD